MSFETFIFKTAGGWAMIGVGITILVILYWPWWPARKVPKEKDEPWSVPIGQTFAHCFTVATVIDDGYFDGSDWREGVLCHYRDDSGRIRELFFTPAQWEQLKGAGNLRKVAE